MPEIKNLSSPNKCEPSPMHEQNRAQADLAPPEKCSDQVQWDHLRSSLGDSMKSWLELEETLRGAKSAEETQLEEMKNLILHIHNQLKDFK